MPMKGDAGEASRLARGCGHKSRLEREECTGVRLARKIYKQWFVLKGKFFLKMALNKHRSFLISIVSSCHV